MHIGIDNRTSSASYLPQPGYPPQSPTGYPPQSPTGYPPQSPTGYPPQPAPTGYPPQSAPTGYPPQSAPTGYPPQSGYPPQPAATTNQVSNTTVVIQQPQLQMALVQRPQPWSTDLCACCDDVGLCLLGLFCPYILPCVVSTKAGECCCVGSLWPVALRASIRERYNIQGDICSDCCVLNYCYLCALCQMGREIDIQLKK